MGHFVVQHHKEDLGAGATVEMADGKVKNGQWMYKERWSQAQGMEENGLGAQEQFDDTSMASISPSTSGC